MGCNASKVRELREMLAARDQEMDQLLERKNREVATLKWQKATTESASCTHASGVCACPAPTCACMHAQLHCIIVHMIWYAPS